MEGIPMRSAGISTSDRERTGIREGALFSCRICRMYGVYGSPACWYAGLLYLRSAIFIDSKGDGNRAAPWQKGLQDEERQGA